MSCVNPQDLLEWCAALVSDTIGDDDFARLKAALASDAEARRIYVAYVHLHRGLALWSAADAGSVSSAMPPVDTSGVSDPLALLGQVAESSAAQSSSPQSSLPRPAPIGHLTWLHSALPPRLISLAVFVLLLGYFGLLLTNLMLEHGRLAKVPAAAPNSNDRPAKTLAGADRPVERLALSAEGRWRGRPATPDRQAAQLLDLEAGSAQFDLTGGTRLVVAAPARFRIESAARVWLERGQLVAHVGPQGSGFTVATPAAEVIDLGTEFGVEVEESAVINVVVRQGKVDVKPAPAASARPKEIQRLRAGQAVRVSARGAITSLGPADAQRKADRFATLADKLPAAGQSAPKLLAWYRLGEDDVAPAPGTPPVAETQPNAATASAAPLEILGSVLYTDQVEAPRSRRALCFGPDAASQLEGPGPDATPTDNFVLAAWVRVESAEETVLVAHWGDDGIGVSLALMGGEWCGIFQGVTFLRTGVKHEPRKWTHLALVRERGQAHFYVDGRIVGGPWFEAPRPTKRLLTIGKGKAFRGQIDEVRLLDVRGGFRPEMLAD